LAPHLDELSNLLALSGVKFFIAHETDTKHVRWGMEHHRGFGLNSASASFKVV